MAFCVAVLPRRGTCDLFGQALELELERGDNEAVGGSLLELHLAIVIVHGANEARVGGPLLELELVLGLVHGDNEARDGATVRVRVRVVLMHGDNEARRGPLLELVLELEFVHGDNETCVGGHC